MATQRLRQRHPFRAKAIAVAVGACFSVSVQTVLAAPTGATVVSGTATVSQQGNLTTVTNSPGAVINWQAFSIGANEITRFIQQSAASSVLNRVVGVDPSIILGVLQSNGRVLLINPNGIVFGAGAQIDVAGLVASSLNLSNADFAAGRLRFTDTPGAGSVNNQGAITTPTGGQVYLIAPNVQNSGIITSPQGEIILAAGRSVDLVDAGTPNLRIEITAPDTQAINIGQIIARSGKIGIYAALVKNSGEIRADGVVVGANGEILLRAKQNVTLENGSVISASGPTAGKITIQAESGTVALAGRLEANATQGKGGTINISGQSITADSGVNISASGTQGGTVIFTATGTASAAGAGQIKLNTPSVLVPAGNQISVVGGQSGGALTVTTPSTGNTVLLSDAATIGGASIVQAGEGSVVLQGTIAVTGSEGRGGNVSITAHNEITLDATSRILANGQAGGEVRVEATKGTLLASGLIDATGSNGPGGMVLLLAPRVALLRRAIVDVSGAVGGGLALIGGDFQGRNSLIQNASRTYFGSDAIIRADATSSGNGGKVIIWSDDGTQAYGTISARGGALSGNGGFVEVSGKAWLDFSASVNTSAPHGKFGTLLLDPKNLEIITGGGAFLGNHLFGDNPGGDSTIDPVNINGLMTPVFLQADNNITFTDAIGMTNAGTSLTAQAGNSIFVNANIITNSGNITLIANETTANGVIAGNRDPGAAVISMAPGTLINAGTGDVRITMGTGVGHTGAVVSGDITLSRITGRDMFIEYDGYNSNSNILMADAASVITARSIIIDLWNPTNVTVGGGSIGAQLLPIKVTPNAAFGTNINVEAHSHLGTGGIYIESTGNMTIGGAVLFAGAAKGVQTMSGGPIELTAAGTLTTQAGTAVCGFGGGTGGPICAGGGVYNPGDTVFLRAADMNLQRVVSGWDVYLAPYGSGTVTLGSAGAGGSLHLSQAEVNFVDAFTFNIGDQLVSGDVNFAGNLTTPALFGIRTSGHIASGGFTLTVGGTGNGNVDLYAQTGIQLNIKAATLSAYNAGATGNINIAETSVGGGTLTLDSGTSTESLRNDAPGGSITLTTTNRNIVVSNPVLAQGDVTLTGAGGFSIDGGGVGNGVFAYGPDGPGSGTGATITLGGGSGGILLDNGAVVHAEGGDAGSGNGGAASVILNSTGGSGITVRNSSMITAQGGYGSNGDGGAASVAITSGTGGILLDSSASIHAYGGDIGSSSFGNGGAASVTLNGSGGSITLDNSAAIYAHGGYSDGGEGGNGGAANITLTTSGTGAVIVDHSALIEATGGGSYYGNSGDATIALTAGTGGIVINNGATINAYGGDGGESSYANGGNASISLIASGDVQVLNGSNIKSDGGDGGEWGGNGGSADILLKSTAGSVLVDHSAVYAYGGDSNYYGDGGNASVTLQVSGGIGGITVIADGGEAASVHATGGYAYDGYGGSGTILLTSTSGPILIDGDDIRAWGGDSNYGPGGNAGVTLTTGGDITLQNGALVRADAGSGHYSGFGTVDIDTPLAAVNITSTGGKVTISSSTVEAYANLQVDGGEGSHTTVNLNNALAAVSINGNKGVVIDGGSQINVSANLSIEGFSGASFDVNANDSLARVYITGAGTGPDSGVTITGSTITVAANVSAYADDNSVSVNLNVCGPCGAPLADVNINGSGVKGVTIDSSTINVTAQANGYASSYSGNLNIGGTLNSPLAQLVITGNGTGAAASGVTITGSTLAVSGQMNAYASSSANVDVNSTLNAPLAQTVIGGSGGTTNGVSITGSSITVAGQMNATASSSATVNVNNTLNAPLASLNISSGNGVSITGTPLMVSGTLSGFESNFGTVNFNGTLNAPLAQIDISGNGGAVNGVTLASSPVMANATFSGDGGEGFTINESRAAAVRITSTAGNINIPGSMISANTDDGGAGVLAPEILLKTTNGYILGDASSGLSATFNDVGGVSPLIELRATKGIGAVGNPIIFMNDQSDIIAINAGPTGDLALGQIGDLNIDNFANITNFAPGRALDITAIGGNLSVGTAVSNPYGSLTLRSGLAGGTLTINGGGTLSTGAGAGRDITLIADDMDIQGPVQSGSGFINAKRYSSGEIWLGSSGFGAGQLELSTSELNLMTGLGGNGGGLVVGDTTTGPVIFKGPVGPIPAYLNVFGTDITQDPGADITGPLNAGASGNIILTNPGNNIGTFSTGTLVGGNVSVVTSSNIDIYDISAMGNVDITSSTGSITSQGGGLVHAGGGTMSFTAATGLSVRVDSAGAGLTATNTGATGNLVLTSTAPTFTVGGGGATISNAAPGGAYYITAQNNMVLNGGTADDRQALFGAGGMLTVNGYSNASGMGVLMVGNNVAFNGATNVSGALGVIAGNNLNVNATVQGGSVDVVAGALNVNGGDFQSTAGNFTGTVTGDVNVAGGGRIYGNPDVNLTVGGTIFINGANSKIEAFSPTSIRVLFPLLASGGFQINGAAGTVWDVMTNTGFFAGGLPAVLGGSLQITYGAVGLPPSVVAAINTIVDATKDKDQDKDKDKDANKEKTGKDEKSVGGNLKMQCN